MFLLILANDASLSSPHAERYRFFFLLILVAFLLAFTYFTIDSNESDLTFPRIFPLVNIGITAYVVIKRTFLLKAVSYDSEYLYIKEKGQEEMIPLTAIKKVELKSMGSRWKINFHPAYTSREQVVFLPSLLYPLNYKKIEKGIDRFHEAVAQVRSHKQDIPSPYNDITSSSELA